MRTKFTYVLLLLFAVGCSYSVDMVKPEKIATSYLMEALKGKADYNQDRKVSLGELIPYLSEQVRRATRSAQSPTVSGKFDPALAIAR